VEILKWIEDRPQVFEDDLGEEAGVFWRHVVVEFVDDLEASASSMSGKLEMHRGRREGG